MGIKSLGIGSACFFDNQIWEIVGNDPEGLVLWHEKASKAIVVKRARLAPIACNQFSVGDRVKSKYTFTGVVTGFEYEVNRVVCVSDKDYSEGDFTRVRYSYAPEEIIKVDTTEEAV